MILPQPCRQLRGKSSTAAHHLYPPWSCDPRVGQTTTALFSFYPPIGPRHGKDYAGYNPKIIQHSKNRKISGFAVGERQSINQRQSKDNTDVAIQIHQSSCYTERIWNLKFILYKRVHATWNKFPFSGQMPVLPQV